MTADELWKEAGLMLQRGQREEVTPEQARVRFNTWLRQKAAGGSPKDLSAETVWLLGEDHSELPKEFRKVLGLQPGATYCDVCSAMLV